MRAHPRPCAVATAAALLALAGGCSEEDTVTVLNPAGPPAIAQLFVEEAGASGPQLAFGSHPDRPGDDGTVVRAAPLQDVQKLRIVMDELLVGRTLEQIECNNPECDPEDPTPVCLEGIFQDVPPGTNSDDLRECTGIFDEDLVDCDELCVINGVAEGVFTEPDGNGVPRANFRLRHNADDEPVVRVVCDGVTMPYDTDRAFWNPSGNQQIPAGAADVEGLGPAIVINDINLKAGANCVLEFDSTVVDKDGNQVCTPANGDFINGACTPGDVSGLSFTVDDLRASTSPRADSDGVRIRPGRDEVRFQFNALLDADTWTAAGAVTVQVTRPNGISGDALPFTFEQVVARENGILEISDSRLGNGFTSLTTYVFTVSDTVSDRFGTTLLAPISLEFTTGELALASEAASDEQIAIDAAPVPFTVAIDPASAPGRVTLREAVSGAEVPATLAVVNNEILVSPDASPAFFPLETDYVVELVGGSLGIADVGGGALPESASFTFTTGAFGARLPADAPDEVPVDGTVDIEFFAVLDPASLAGNIAIADRDGDAFDAFTASATSNIVTIQPDATFEADTRYTITVTGGDTGVRASDGSTLDDDVTFNFTTAAAQ